MKAEIPLSLYLNQLRHPVVLATPTGLLLFANNAFVELFALSSSGKKPHNLAKLFRGNRIILDAIRSAQETHRTHTHREIGILLPSGIQKFMDVETMPVILDDGRLSALSIAFYDRSERAHVEEQKKSSDRIHYLTTISSGLAHEIKNPLSGIKGAAQLLVAALKKDDSLREVAAIIQKEVERVDRLLNDLLHLAKAGTKRFKKTNVNRILHELVLLQKTVRGGSISFVEEFDPSLPDVEADSGALSQLFLNLIKNARQAISGNGTVTIRSHLVTDFLVKKGETTRRMISVEIEDTGCGMDEAALSQIFVPFFTTKPKGTGLGLTLCQKIIEDHEGKIQVKSEKGKGTIFAVYLPV